MKKLSLIPLMAALLILQCCTTNEDAPVTEKTKVTFSLQSSDISSGRLKSLSLDDVTTVVAGLQSGGTTITQHINLVKFGDSYSTEPFELASGTWLLTDFMLENDSSTVLFATPHAGSPLAPIVKHPLNYNFSVAAGKNTTVAMEVVPVDSHSPADFGYATFSVQIARPLSVTAFTTEGPPKFASATAYILHATDTVAKYTMAAKVNLLSFKLDPEETYQLVILKEGFTKYTKTFIYNDLVDELDGLALKALLKPAMTMFIKTELLDYSDPMSFTLTSSSDAVVDIDWGDGTVEAVSVAASAFGNIYHQYPNSSATYYASVSGQDLKKIIEFYAEPTEARVLKFNFDQVPSLTGVNLFLSDIPILDVSKNNNIRYIVFGGKKLIIPDDNKLEIVVIFGHALEAQLDDIISNVYRNAIEKEINNGEFFYGINPDSDGNIPLGIPSDDSLLKLQELEYHQGWIVTPNL